MRKQTGLLVAALLLCAQGALAQPAERKDLQVFNDVANAVNRVGGQLNSRPTLFDCLEGTCESVDSNANINMATQTIFIGSFGGTTDWAFGVVKQVCLDNSPTRCQ